MVELILRLALPGAPSNITRSTGTKLVLYPGVGFNNDADIAIGNESSSMWMSVPSSLFSFKWFVNTINVASLSSLHQMLDYMLLVYH